MDSEYNVLSLTLDTDVNYIITEAGYVSIMSHRYTPSEVIVSSVININDVLKVNTIKWCAIGDSITAGNNTNTGTSYATFAADMIGPKVNLQKLGYWGQKMLDTLATTAFNAIDDNVEIVTINLGSNDLAITSKWMDISIDSIMDKSRDELADNVSTFESLRLFVEKMRETYPSTLIYVITPIRRSDRTDDVMNKFVELEKEICNRLDIPCIDAHNESGIRKSDSIYLLYEESSSGEMVYVHPNDLGKEMIAKWLVSKINFNQIVV